MSAGLRLPTGWGRRPAPWRIDRPERKTPHPAWSAGGAVCARRSSRAAVSPRRDSRGFARVAPNAGARPAGRRPRRSGAARHGGTRRLASRTPGCDVPSRRARADRARATRHARGRSCEAARARSSAWLVGVRDGAATGEKKKSRHQRGSEHTCSARLEAPPRAAAPGFHIGTRLPDRIVGPGAGEVKCKASRAARRRSRRVAYASLFSRREVRAAAGRVAA
jgi:hypothetical protein